MDRLADKLRRAARATFVGRDAEKAAFTRLLDADEPQSSLIYLYGPGGVGKTSLVSEFRWLCEERRVPFLIVDGRSISEPSDFLRTLGGQLGISDEQDAVEALEQRMDRQVLVVDTYEEMGAVEPWLVSDFLPSLPEDFLVVLAGRNPPSDLWRRTPGWSALMDVIPLRNLNREESRTYLTSMGVEPGLQQDMMETTHGHPLALALYAEVYRLQGASVLQDREHPDVVRSLLDRFVMEVPSPAHRSALEASALVRFMTQSLLAWILEIPDVREVFDWLGERSFVDVDERGLFPHDIAREVLSSDLRWRNPEWYGELHGRARAFYTDRLRLGDASAQRNTLSDLVYLHRDSPVVKPIYRRVRAQVAGEESATIGTFDSGRDTDPIIKMVGKHEGDASAELAREWLRVVPDGVTVFRSASTDVVGFILTVELGDESQGGFPEDPAIESVRKYLHDQAPLRPGEHATIFRFWMTSAGYQAVSRTQISIFLHTVHYYLTSPGLAFSFLPCAHPSLYRIVLGYGDLKRIKKADFKVGGKKYGMFGHDWRERPPEAWLDLMAQRQSGRSAKLESPAPSRPLIVLSRDQFDSAVQAGMKMMSRPHKLRSSPLLASNVVVSRCSGTADEAARIETLVTVLTEAIESLRHAGRLDSSYRAIDRTYLRPASSQEAAAEMLAVPYSTFRRHLKKGVHEVCEILWAAEVGTPSPLP